MRVNIFTKIMLALISVIVILSSVFIFTSLKNANDWAGRQTVEFRDSLKDKYQILIQTVAGNLESDHSPDIMQINSLIVRHPEIKSIKVVRQDENGKYKIVAQAGSVLAEKETSVENDSNDSHVSDSKKEDSHASSGKKEGEQGSLAKDDNSGANDKNDLVKEAAAGKSTEELKISLAELKQLDSGKSIANFQGDIEGHSGSHDVMIDKQFLKIIEPFDFTNISGYKMNTKAAVIAEVSLIGPLKDIHMKHLETSSYFIQISVIAGVLSTLLALLVGGFIARGITRPVKKLMTVAEDVSMGRDVHDIDVKSNDEIGDLADSFQRMVTAVKFLMMKEGDEDESTSADS